jgi:uncharacterized surface protein with fasciclin (FAS1) repeats
MKKTLQATITAITLAVLAALGVAAQMKGPAVGGVRMSPTKTIVENAANSPIHKTLVAAITAADLIDTLNGPGPFTVFAPTDDAFAKLPAATVLTLDKPENKDTLVKILTYHVVPGTIGSTQLIAMIKKGDGKTELKTVQGESLIATMSGMNIIITDAKCAMATVTTADVFQSNGIIHIIDTVLMPD